MKKLILNVQKMIDLYNKGLSCKKISEIFNVSEGLVKNRLKSKNIKIRNLRDCHLIKKFDENFFNKINTENKAYWLGFMFADGNVRENIHKRGYKSYIISLSQLEKCVLEQFIKSISGSNIKISEWKTKKGKIAYSVSLNSKIMFDDLVKQGCIPKKSLVLKFPNLKKSLIRHFIRGYFDGDGSISSTNYNVIYKNHTTRNKSCYVNICGTLEFLSSLKDCLSFINEKGVTKEKRNFKNVWSLRFSGYKRIMLFYNLLYEDATIFLHRKKDKFEQIIKEKGSTTIISYPIKDKGIV